VAGESLIVVDTHALVWLTSGEPLLGRRARALLDAALETDTLAVSAISFWEVAMLAARGRIALGSTAEAWRTEILNLGVNEVPVDGKIAMLSVSLPRLHADPADRIIVATAIHAGATLLTADERLLDWKNPLRRHDARR
jgi:PIN domain nuclease of toxin-antitoxin system